MTMNAKEKRLVYAIGLSLSFMIVEVVGGWLANSIAIYSDAAHLLTDVAGFGIALVAVTAARAPGTEFLTFGLVRVEIFGALLSVLSLWVISAVLLWAAYDRAVKWFEGRPEPIDGRMMLAVALFGVFVNLCLGYIFQEEHGHSLAHDHSHGHAHGHSHGHGSHAEAHDEHDCEQGGHDHGHAHGHGVQLTERSSLMAGSARASSGGGQKYTILDADDHDGHDHDHGHDHGHHHNQQQQQQQQCAHDHGHGHGHQADACSHDHGHSHAPQADDLGAAAAKKATVVDANLEAAQLHVLADLAQSVGVAAAALVILLWPDWQIVDPLCTLLATVFGLWSTMPLIRRGLMILLEGVPAHVDWRDVQRRLEAIPGVDDVHDLHIWSLSSDTTSLSVHMRAQDPRDALRRAHAVCRQLDIVHATIQVHDAADDEYCHAESCKTTTPLPPHADGKTLAGAARAAAASTAASTASSAGSRSGGSPAHGHDHRHR